MLTPITKLSDPARLRVGLEKPEEGYQYYIEGELIKDVTRLLNALPSFVIYPISSLPGDTQPLTPEQIARVKSGSKDRKTSWFLHTIKVTARDTRRYSNPEKLWFLTGEDYVDIGFNYVWPEVGKRGSARTNGPVYFGGVRSSAIMCFGEDNSIE